MLHTVYNTQCDWGTVRRWDIFASTHPQPMRSGVSVIAEKATLESCPHALLPRKGVSRLLSLSKQRYKAEGDPCL